MPTQPQSTVAVIDDDQIVCKVTMDRLTSEDDFTPVGSARQPDEAIELLRAASPDLVLYDAVYFCPEDVSDALGFAKTLSEASPTSRLLLWTCWDGDDNARVGKISRAFHLGVEDFFTKDDLDTAIEALRRAAAREGGSPPLLEKLSDLISRGAYPNADHLTDGLTEKERYWAATAPPLLENGARWNEIASNHFISPAALQTHRANLYRKWNVNSVASFIAEARRRGYYS